MEDEEGPKLRIKIHYSYSDVQRFESLRQEWYNYIEEDLEEYELIKDYLQNLTNPFEFMKMQMDENKGDRELNADDIEDLAEQRNGDTRFHQQEKEYEKQVDDQAKQLLHQFGYRVVPWLGVTYFFLVGQMILAMLTMMHRKDCLTITVCCVGFYMLSYPDIVRRSQFRMLVGLIGLSLVQDVFWFMLNDDLNDDSDDGGMEKNIKLFARSMSWLSFFWRVSLNRLLLILLSVFL